jgi:hypothetical protein
MGVHVHLAVFTDRVPDTRWQEIYEKARRVVSRWTPRPLSSKWRQIGAVQVAEYGLEPETEAGLHIVGDAETLTTGESFVFPARLDRTASLSDAPPVLEDDVLVAVARRTAADIAAETAPCRPWQNLLGGKTQGLPYHALIVALGLLVESSLPGTAVVYGELSPRDGEQARQGLASILGEDLAPPVVMDTQRLRRRLATALHGDTLDRALRVLGPPDPYAEAVAGELLGLLRRSADAQVRRELEHVVCSCADPRALSTETQLLFRRLLDVIRSNMVLGEVRERAEQWGTARTREELARRTVASRIRLSSMAWDAIEAADLDELAFLYAATCTNTTRFEVHHAVRAMFENRGLRSL